MSITDAQLRKTYTKEIWLTEGVTRGGGQLAARCSSASIRFYFRYKLGGKHQTLSLGLYARSGDGAATFTLAQAADRADQLRALRVAHPDLKAHFVREAAIAEERKQAELVRLTSERLALEALATARDTRLTVTQLFDRWERMELAERKDKGAFTRRAFEKDVLPNIGSMAIEDVKRSHIANVVDRMIETRGVRQMAQHVLADLKQMFTFAAKRGLIEADPATVLQQSDLGAKSSRDRTLSIAEAKALKQMLPVSGLSVEAQHFVWLSLGTAGRTSEMLSTLLSDIDLATRTVVFRDTKNATDMTVTLSEFAVVHITPLMARAKSMGSNYLFPSRHSDVPINVKTFTKQITDRQRFDKPSIKGRSSKAHALELGDRKWTPHDLRRTCSTWMVEHCGVAAEVANQCLNHLPKDRMIRVYIRATYGAQTKAAWVKLGEFLDEVVGRD